MAKKTASKKLAGSKNENFLKTTKKDALVKREEEKPISLEQRLPRAFYTGLPTGMRSFMRRMDEYFAETRKDFRRERERIDRIFADYKISYDVKTEADKYLVTMNLGKNVKPEDVKLEYDENDMLVMSVKKEEKTKGERRLTQQTMSRYLPGVEFDKVNTDYKDGILKIEMPFTTARLQEYKPRLIPIKTATEETKK
jgi:HSP20 family molecular chaperone IbpA